MAKKVLFILISGIMLFGIVGCGKQKLDIIDVSSKLYSDSEIQSAIDVVFDYFKKYYKGCTLTKISYIGDEKNSEYIDWAKRNNKDEAIVLISEFKTSSTVSQPLNPNNEYTNYIWILIRNKNENWQHADHGY